MKLKQGDKVVVISGKDKGKEGKIMGLLQETGGHLLLRPGHIFHCLGYAVQHGSCLLVFSTYKHSGKRVVCQCGEEK